MSHTYCLDCERFVESSKNWSWLGFIVFHGLYFLYYLFKTKRCPICNGKRFSKSKPS